MKRIFYVVMASIFFPLMVLAEELRPRPDIPVETIRELANLAKDPALHSYNWGTEGDSTPFRKPSSILSPWKAILEDDLLAKVKGIGCNYTLEDRGNKWVFVFSDPNCSSNMKSIEVSRFPSNPTWGEIRITTENARFGRILHPILPYNIEATQKLEIAKGIYGVDPSWWSANVGSFSDYITEHEDEVSDISKGLATAYFSAVLEEKNFTAYYYDALFDIIRTRKNQ